jgi:restriction endonuclease Mrr
MPNSVQVKKYLRQLSVEELLKLAKQKKLQIPESWEKTKIIEHLSLSVTQKEIIKIVSKKTHAITKEGLGYESALSGKTFEDRAMKYLQSKGYKCDKNEHITGAELDIIGIKKTMLGLSEEYVIAECKNLAKVTAAQFKKFIGSKDAYVRRKGWPADKVTGYFFTTGIFDANVKSLARDYPDIILKRINS